MRQESILRSLLVVSAVVAVLAVAVAAEAEPPLPQETSLTSEPK